MLLLFFVTAVLMCVLIALLNNRTLTKVLTAGFAILHIGLTVYSWINLNDTELVYFTYNSTGCAFAFGSFNYDNSNNLSRIYLFIGR